MTAATVDAAWVAEPERSLIAALRKECRAIARRRAALAAATSLIPVPGIDLATDLALMTRMIKRINEHFGLSEAQIGRLSSQRQALVYRLLASAGGTLAALQILAGLGEGDWFNLITYNDRATPLYAAPQPWSTAARSNHDGHGRTPRTCP